MKMLEWPEGKDALTNKEIKESAVDVYDIDSDARGIMVRIDNEIYFIKMSEEQMKEARRRKNEDS